jgi:hypothetical protein
MLVVTIEGWHKVLALKSQIEVPLANIRGARVRPELPKFVDPDFRGTYVPGRVVAGYNLTKPHDVVFCDVEDPARAIAIDLVEGELKHIIVELSNVSPEDAVAQIEAARLSLPNPNRVAQPHA